MRCRTAQQLNTMVGSSIDTPEKTRGSEKQKLRKEWFDYWYWEIRAQCMPFVIEECVGVRVGPVYSCQGCILMLILRVRAVNLFSDRLNDITNTASQLTLREIQHNHSITRLWGKWLILKELYGRSLYSHPRLLSLLQRTGRDFSQARLIKEKTNHKTSYVFFTRSPNIEWRWFDKVNPPKCHTELLYLDPKEREETPGGEILHAWAPPSIRTPHLLDVQPRDNWRRVSSMCYVGWSLQNAKGSAFSFSQQVYFRPAEWSCLSGTSHHIPVNVY